MRKPHFFSEKDLGTKQHITTKYQDGCWSGEPIYIIGGGPSVNQYNNKYLRFHFDRFLTDKKVIGINRAFQFFTNVDINLGLDVNLYRWIMEKEGEGLNKPYRESSADFVFVDIVNYPMDEIFYIYNAGAQGLGKNLADGIFCYSNTGYAAINLAYVLNAGTAPIYLIGYDLCFHEDKAHYHDQKCSRDYEIKLMAFEPGLNNLAALCQEAGVKVINLSKISQVTCFQKRYIWEGFENRCPFLEAEYQKDMGEKGALLHE